MRPQKVLCWETLCFGVLALLAVVLLMPAGAVAGGDEGKAEKPYRMVDGKVDFGTYNGFRRYHSICHTCHGPDALGSTYAPNLVESMKTISYAKFLAIVAAGQTSSRGGAPSVMPAFGDNPDVINYIDDIYAYLMARADGVLGRGRPQRLPKGQ